MAKEAPIPYGRTRPQIYTSLGPQSYIMNHYATTSSIAFAKPHLETNKLAADTVPPSYNGEQVFRSTVGAKFDIASGFTSNERPFLGYKRSLDQLDNPLMGFVSFELIYT